MENIDHSKIARIFFAIFISIFLYGAYFYNLVRQQLMVMVQKQTALESIKAIAVPGTSYLNNIEVRQARRNSLIY